MFESPPRTETPHSRLAAFLINCHYAELGCDRWNARRVQLLCAKFGDTPAVMAERMRLKPLEFSRRMLSDQWTKQDGLILSILEREIDAQRGDVLRKPLIAPDRTIPKP